MNIYLIGDSDISARQGLAQSIKEYGFNSKFIGTTGCKDGFDKEGEGEIFEYRFNRKSIFRAIFESTYDLFKIAKKSDKGIAHSFDTIPGLVSSIPFKICGHRLTKTITGMGKAYKRINSNKLSDKAYIFAYMLAQRISCSMCDYVVFQNSHDLQYFQKNKIVRSEDKCVLIPGSGIPIPCLPTESKPVKKTIGIIMISRIIEHKGVIEYLMSANVIAKSFPDVNFSFAGDFQTDSSGLEKDLFLDNLGDVNFLGQLDDLTKEYENNDILVLPSDYGEGVPRVLLEASSYGLALVTTNAPGCGDVINHCSNGLIAKMSVESITLSIETLLNKGRPKIRTIGENGIRTVIGKFDIHTIASSYASIFKKTSRLS